MDFVKRGSSRVVENVDYLIIFYECVLDECPHSSVFGHLHFMIHDKENQELEVHNKAINTKKEAESLVGKLVFVEGILNADEARRLKHKMFELLNNSSEKIYDSGHFSDRESRVLFSELKGRKFN